MRALGAYIFAGGFTVGVKKHFEVLAHLEGNNYGVATAKKNFPDLPIYYGPDKWPLTQFKHLKSLELVYGNPPCAPWSQAGGVVFNRDWRDDPRVDCVKRHFSLLEELRPSVWVWESVPRAFTVGRELVDHLTAEAVKLGYSVTYLLHNAKWLGVPQNRPRFFFIAHAVKLNFDEVWPDFTLGPTPLQTLRQMNDIGEETMKLSEELTAMLPELSPGKRLVELWDAKHPPETAERNAQGRLKGRPPFCWHRVPPDRPANAVVGNLIIHPEQDRPLTIKEMAALCGFPPDFEFVGSGQGSLIARGVVPSVAEWLARLVKRSVELDERSPAPLIELVDVREPPGSRQFIDNIDREEPTMPRATQAPTSQQEPTRLGDVKPKQGVGSGAYIRTLLMTGQFTRDQILDLVHKHYPDSKAGPSDINWNKGKLKKDGFTVPQFRGDASAPPAPAPVSHEPQPTRKELPQRVDTEREFDKTSLREAGYGYRVHRDYASHFFRWGWTYKFIDKHTELLEVGCGVDCPLVKALMSDYGGRQPASYVGVDLNKLPKPPNRPWATFHEEFNFIERHKALGAFDMIVNFEVIEHMTKKHGAELLAAMYEHLKADGTLLLSTPVFNGKAAANHIHEYTIPELQEAVEAAGFKVVKRYGTFANYRDIKKVATPEQVATLDGINQFYSTDVTACFLAPLYPDASRNNVWVLKRR